MAVSLLANLCNSGLEQLCQTPEPLKFYYHHTNNNNNSNNNNDPHHHHLHHQLQQQRVDGDGSEEEQMEYNSSFYQHQQQQQQQQSQHSNHQQQQQQNQQDFEEISQNYNLDNDDNYSGSPNNFQDYRNNFVDSPPDSKEAWPVEYSKMQSAGLVSASGNAGSNNNNNSNSASAVAAVAAAAAAVAAAQQQESPYSVVMPTRKRRIEWMTAHQEEENDGSEPKIANTDKERDTRRKGSMRWPEELDLDLSNELSSNGYISDSLLNFPVFKQELPSPPQKPGHEVIKSLKNAAGSSSMNHHHHHQQLQNQDQQQQQQQHHNQTGSQSNLGGNNGGNANGGIPQPSGGNDQSLVGGMGTGSSSGNVAGLQNFIHANRYDSSGNINQASENVQRSDGIHNDNRFQYVLAAATSIATKNNEESLTYLNQGQSYEIKLKKLGDLSPFRGKILKSIIKICFHERRLQYMEREQMQLWQASRPGERILDVDIPLSYGLIQVQPNSSSLLNTMEVYWDPMKEVGVYIKVNCISTEFTPKKHGGEKGVPFRIQVETYLDSTLNDGSGNSSGGMDGSSVRPLHAAACQIKVFKLKGADRKHKQDREKILKRPPAEQEKFQRSCECTILTDITTESMLTPLVGSYSPEHIKRNISPILVAPTSPVHINKFENIMSSFCNGAAAAAAAAASTNPANKSVAMAAAAVAAAVSSNPITIGNVSSTNGLCKLMDQNVLSPPQNSVEMDDFAVVPNITKDCGPAMLTQWLNYHRLSAYSKTFSQFSGSDLLRMSKEDLCKICGLADGIRMFNILHSKAITPRLTIYVCFEGSMYHAIYLHGNTISELVHKLQKIPGFTDVLQGMNSSDNSGSPWLGNYQRAMKSTVAGGSGGNKYSSVTISDAHTSIPSPSSPISSSSIPPRLNLLVNGPNGVHVLLTEDVLSNIKDESLFQLEVKPNGNVLMKAVASVGGGTSGGGGENDMN